MYVPFADQLNVGCFNYGPSALGPALPAVFLPVLSSARCTTSVMALTTSLVPTMPA